jgi:hypothetical protein
MTRIALFVIAAFALGLSACTNPYDPVQRGLGGGILGAASGAAIGAAAGGGPGAALGAAIGGATGIFGGVASTPPPPPGTYFGYPAYGPPGYGYPGYAQQGYGYPGYSGYPAYSRPPGYAYPGYSGGPAYSGPPGYELPTGRLGPSTLSSLLAELRPRIHPQCLTPLAAGESERLRKIDCPCKGWALNLRSAPIGTTVSRGSPLTPGPGGLASRGRRRTCPRMCSQTASQAGVDVELNPVI